MAMSYSKVDEVNAKFVFLGSAPWTHYVEDHKRFLIRNSKKVAIPNEIFNTHGASPKRVLTELGVSDEVLSILLIINDMDHSRPLKEHHRSIWKPSQVALDIVTTSFNE